MEYRIPQYVTTVKKEDVQRRDVQRVVVHTAVTEIADDAFRDWTNLREVVFEPGSRLRRVGTYAFAGTVLESFAAPDGLREIGICAFMGCKNLREVKLNEGLESLGKGAFRDSGVEEVRLPSSLRTMGESAFVGCGSLQKVEVGADCGALAVAVRVVGGALEVEARREVREDSDGSVQIELEDADALREQLEQSKKQTEELKEQLATHIKQSEEQRKELLKHNAQLQRVIEQSELKRQMLQDTHALVVPDGTEVVGNSEYSDEDYERVFIPKSVVEIQESAFNGCKNLKEVVIEEGSKLKTIGNYCFQNSGLKEITLPKALKNIDYCAFQNCRNLRTIYVEEGCGAYLSYLKVPDSTEIGPLPEVRAGNMKVWDLRKQKDAVIPKGIEKIENHWFRGSEIEGITIPASVREIGTDAFYDCKNLKQIAFAEGSTLEKIGNGSFCKSGIKRIVIPKGVVEIQAGAFGDCENLKEVAFEAGSVLKKIGGRAFWKCTRLKNIEFPDSLETIGTQCFQCSGLEAVVFPASVKSIGPKAFYECKQLKSTQLNEGQEKLKEKQIIDGHTWEGEVFSGSAIESIKLPSTLKRLEQGTFYNCENLKRIEIPNGVEYIGSMCFWSSGIEEITLPGTLKEIGIWAFDHCFSLKTVWVEEGCALDVRKYVGPNVEVYRK